MPKYLSYWSGVVLEKLLVSCCSRKFCPFTEIHCWVYKSPLLEYLPIQEPTTGVSSDPRAHCWSILRSKSPLLEYPPIQEPTAGVSSDPRAHCWSILRSTLHQYPTHTNFLPLPLQNQHYYVLFSNLTLAIAHGCFHLEFSFEIVYSLLTSPIRAVFPPTLFSFNVLPHCLNKGHVNYDIQETAIANHS